MLKEILLAGTTYFLGGDNYFEGPKYADKIMYAELVDLNKDGKPDLYKAFFDLNGNGKPDHIALFVVQSYNKEKNTADLNQYASMLGVDYNEDGQIDEVYIDTDNNGSLDSLVEEEQGKRS